MQTGEIDRALSLLEELTLKPDRPGYVTYGSLKLLRVWNPLRNHPRFQQIVNSLAPK